MHAHNHNPLPHDQGDSTHALLVALALVLSFSIAEAAGAWWSGSLALLGDAAHMVSDAAALGIAALAAWVARKPPSARHSYGLGRAEVMAALGNGLLMVAVVAGIAVVAIERLHAPRPVAGGAVLIIAGLGLGVNVLVAVVLSRSHRDLNTRAALLHVMGDLLGSVAALLSGAVIYFTGWTPIDPLLSLFIGALILYSSLRLLLEALQILMEAVPPHLNLGTVGTAVAGVDGIASVHDLHIWTLSSGSVALSAHVVLTDLSRWEEILQATRRLLAEKYGIDHVTLQPEAMMELRYPVTELHR